MKLALIQMSPVTGDLKGNLERIKKEIALARNNGADLAVFPEMALTGYCISDLVEDDLFVETNKELLKEIAKETKNIAAIIGFIDYDKGKINNDGRIRKYNAAALLQNGKIRGIAHKALLPNYRYFDDKRYFTPGETRNPLPIQINGKKLNLGISICEDMWDENYDIKPIKELAHKGADILININASPFCPGKINKREEIIKRHIKETGLAFIYVNTVGSADNGKNIIPFDGQSLVYDKKANLIVLGKQFEEETILIDLEKASTINKPQIQRERELFEALVMSLKDYAKQSGFKRAILPLSGGIDSALGLVITAEAFGKENVTAYNLPSRFNTIITKGIAERLAKNLGVEYKIIPIQEIDNTIINTFEGNAHAIKNKIAKENLHARIRGMLMMLESNDTSALLISNGNKTEIALGYSTLYGDMCGGISVIGDLSKTEVYNLSAYVNKRYGKEIMPEEVLTIKPSAELSEGQFDPFDYPLVSPLVDLFVEERDSPIEIIEKFKNRSLGNQFPKEIYQHYSLELFEKLVKDTYRMLKRSVYKRLQGPPIIAVTGRSFGFDLRETLINKWEGVI
ncbi:MAG: NAD+ synthase [Nanoarchaeota archaeon]|nr:NAD+ synthase [Nanoarchaeota archaeon]